MAVFHEVIDVQSELVPTFHDVTEQARTVVKKSGIQNGICVVYS